MCARQIEYLFEDHVRALMGKAIYTFASDLEVRRVWRGFFWYLKCSAPRRSRRGSRRASSQQPSTRWYTTPSCRRHWT